MAFATKDEVKAAAAASKAAFNTGDFAAAAAALGPIREWALAQDPTVWIVQGAGGEVLYSLYDDRTGGYVPSEDLSA